MNITINPKGKYSALINNIGSLLEQGRKQAYHAVNQILVRTYWEIGNKIIEYEQEGKEKAEYGSALLNNLSKDLKLRYGKRFSRRNILDMRRFYLSYPKWQTVSAELGWSHYVELLSIEEDIARQFYENQSLKENWSVRELKRQINSALFQRVALSKDKTSVIELSKNGLVINTAKDVVRDPYVLEFLNIPENENYSEKKLYEKIIEEAICKGITH